jgi:hypothetical protein
MPLWIVAHSDALCNFLLPLLVELNSAQQRHALNVVAALLVCTRLKHRTLAALTRVLRVLMPITLLAPISFAPVRGQPSRCNRL